MDRRWQLTDFQRVIIFVAVVVTVFLAAMAWGAGNPWLLLAAVAVLVGSVVGVIAVVVRRGAGTHQIATARVLSVSAPPPNAGARARCDMRLAVQLAGDAAVEVRHRDPAVPLIRWPQVGQTYPVDVFGGNPNRRLHIRWDLVEMGMVRAPEPSRSRPAGGLSGGQFPLWEDNEGPLIISPTPPRPQRRSVSPDSSSAPEAGIFLHEEFTERPAAGPSQRNDPAAAAQPNGHDPDGYDPADFEAPRLAGTTASIVEPVDEHQTGPAAGAEVFESLELPDIDPARVDRRDFSDDTSARDAVPASMPYQHATSGSPSDSASQASPGIPTPRGPGTSATRSVARLDRSLRFYRDGLGFSVTFQSAGSAIVELQGTRVLLELSGGTSGHRAGATAIHLDVPDVDAACRAATAHDGTVVEPAAAVNEGGTIALWRALLQDPDGYDIEVLEWRQRKG
jgi:predicted enzyme related to lactoylglutathione lyase